MAADGVPPALQRAAGYAWRLLVVGLALGVLLFALFELKVVVLPIIAALFLSTVLVPPARWLEARRVPPALASLAVVGALLGALVLAGITVGNQIGEEFGELGEQVRRGLEEAERIAADEPFNLDRADLERLARQARDQFGGGEGGGLGRRVAAGATLAAEIVTGFLLTLVVLFFFVKDREELTGWIVGKVRPDRREDVRALGRRAWEILRSYVRGTAIIASVDATIIGIGLLLIGVPLVLPLALLTFLGAFLPLVGAVAAGVVAVLVALVSGGIGDALLVVAVVVVVQEVEGDVLAPVVLGRAVRLHPLVVVLALATGAVSAGLLGAFLAVPTTAVITGMANEWRKRHPQPS